jgi:hypothetical protein
MKWRIIIIFLVLFFSVSHLFAEEKKEIKKYTIAVSNFESNNCKPGLSRAVADILAGKIYTIDFFILLERNQMNLIMMEKGVRIEKFTNPEEAAKVGKILSVQKMVVGSVSKLGRYYRIEVRVVNVDDGKVDVSLSDDADSEGNLQKAVVSIADNIERYYLGYAIITGKFDVSINGSVVHSFGSFSKGTGFGYGCNLNFYWNKPFGWPVPFIVYAGFYAFPPTIESIQSIYLMPVEIHLGYKFNLAKNVKLLPWLGGGYILSWISNDPIERVLSKHSFKNSFYYNPVLSAGVEFNILLHSRYILLFTPVYKIFFEKRRLGQFAGADVGMKILF